MRITAAIVTYRRGWALPLSLNSLVKQTRKPDEVLIVLKPSGDNSEEVIRQFSDRLPIRLLIQKSGNFVDAVDMAIKNATSDLILFLDDDAIAEERWVEKYEKLFQELDDAGGISSSHTYVAYLRNSSVELTDKLFYNFPPTKAVYYRRPLPEYSEYCEWIAISGFMGSKNCDNRVIKSTALGGVNMAWRKRAVEDCPLSQLYKRSRKGLWNEQTLAYCAKRRGYNTYKVLDRDIAPIVWHISHSDSLTRQPGFKSEFWLHYDRVVNFKRLKRLGAKTSYLAWVLALFATMRRRPIPRLFATIYGLLVGI